MGVEKPAGNEQWWENAEQGNNCGIKDQAGKILSGIRTSTEKL